MPNHCHNRVTFYGSGNDTDETRAQIEKIRKMFDDENIFTQIIPEPDWLNTPLMSSDVPKYSWDQARARLVSYLSCKQTGMASHVDSSRQV